MSNILKYKDIIAFHPGYYIEEIIEDSGMTQAEFAARLGTTAKTLSCLINGQANISNDIAKKLSVMLGSGEEGWLNLQKNYDQKLIEIQKEKDFDEQTNLADMIDYSYFETIIETTPAGSAADRVANLCSYFMVSDLRIMLKPDFLINYKVDVTPENEKIVLNSRAWLQTAINQSNGIETRPYDSNKLKSSLPVIRSMTIMPSDVFLPKLRQVFSECGIAFVLLPNLKNSGVNGAVRWINEDRVVLAMNNSNLDADSFWFSLFHEIRHVLQKKTKTVFINYAEKDVVETNDQLEDDADRFATNFLIPPSELKKFSPSKNTSDEEIITFAKSIGIHPGIVAGRLQSEGIIAANRCNKLKEKYHLEKHTA